MAFQYGWLVFVENADDFAEYARQGGLTALEHVKRVRDSGRKMGWIVFWSGWTNNYMSLDLIYEADELMKDEFIYDLSESRKILLDAHYTN